MAAATYRYDTSLEVSDETREPGTKQQISVRYTSVIAAVEVSTEAWARTA